MPEQDIESLGVMGWGVGGVGKFFRRRRRRRRRRPQGVGPGPARVPGPLGPIWAHWARLGPFGAGPGSGPGPGPIGPDLGPLGPIGVP